MSRDLIRAIAMREPGGPDVLEIVEVEMPSPAPGQVLIKVAAAGVNRPDQLQRLGRYPLPPGTTPVLGLEVAGEIVEVAPNTDRWKVGDKVAGLTPGGGYAEYCAIDGRHCIPWPEGLSASEAATLPEVGFTVEFNMMMRAGYQPGETVLIHGGSSGIGAFAIQRAKAIGGTVFITAGTKEKCDFCRDLGADHTINYKETDWAEEARRILGEDGGIDVILDMVAGDYTQKNIDLLGLDGRYAFIAVLGGAKAEINTGQILRKRLTLTGSALRPLPADRKAGIVSRFEKEVLPHVAAGRIKSPIYKTFAFEDVSAAHALMDSGVHMGKICLTL